ncbi:Pyridoxal reductase, chloroplastic [Porphyridium purpureum]|uniref:Pyridoxal reductase, chloroplastic n=1 Tax=Porphyridium purpureum TaxID=35688 RepID=A0A5J4Z6Z5_PORPP|nr:Pyridoxal reductase, chloroplastic [Porphyridium purpureum]|eukprot:POR1024..scf295_1
MPDDMDPPKINFRPTCGFVGSFPASCEHVTSAAAPCRSRLKRLAACGIRPSRTDRGIRSRSEIRAAAASSGRAAGELSLALGPLAGGTWSWGNKVVWGYNQGQDDEIQRAFETLVKGGVFFWDTGDSYGTGTLNAQAEKLLGKYRLALPVQWQPQIQLGTKLASYPWRWTPASLQKAAGASVGRMYPERDRTSLDYAMMHWSPANYLPLQEDYLASAFASLTSGPNRLADKIGVSNLGPKRLTRMAGRLQDSAGVPISVLQVQLSLLCLEPLESGLLSTAAELGIPVLGYSPLALGFLSGAFSGADARSLPPGPRGFVFRRLNSDPRVKELLSLLHDVAAQYEGKTKADIALAWVRAKGATPLVGVRSEQQATKLVNSLSLRLTSSEEAALDAAAKLCKQRMVRNPFQTL